MATYATFAQLVRRYGRRELAALAPGGHGESIDTLAADALVEAAGEIDFALEGLGYATPIDPTTITDADQQARVTATLRRCEIGIAVAALSREHESMPDNMQRDVEWSRGFLDDLAKSKRFPGLSTPGMTTVVSGIETVVIDEDTVTDRIARASAW